MKISIIYSLPSRRILNTKYGETDTDSSVIAKMVKRGLRARNIDVEIIKLSEDNIDTILDLRADCIFNLVEWCGLDIELSKKVFGYLRRLDIPVTGSSEELFVLTGDKIETKKRLSSIGITIPDWQVFETGEEDVKNSLKYPVIVKPSLEHCSIGLTLDSIASNQSQLRDVVERQITSFKQRVLAEEFIRGREFLVYLLEQEGSVRVLPIEEIIFYDKGDLHFQTYETKWEPNSQDYKSTGVEIAKLSEDEREVIASICKNVFKQLGLWGYARFDLRFRDKIPYILETNANPSVYDADEEIQDIESEVIWGIKFPDYLIAIVESAVEHHKQGQRV